MAVEEDPTVAMGVSRKVMTMSVLELRLFPVTEGYCDFEMQKHLRGNLRFITCSKATDTEGFSTGEILRKYSRYALNEKPFNPQLVAAMFQLKKATMLDVLKLLKF
ncbi:hypothetical protein HanIR_Chr16g0811611 [Helianthus annuus]|nr:hypothetical protein HanIR_Chr16g0811611 [Helianthus annuus]